MQKDSEVVTRLNTILGKVEEACKKSGIAYPVKLIGVSKTKTVEEIKQAYDAGQRDFGQNYVDEIQQKSPALPQDIRWHFIGHLQSNKIKKCIVPNLDYLQTIDRESLAEKVNKFLEKEKRDLKILIQVKTSDQESKSGVPIEEVEKLFQFIQKACPRLIFRGLMTIGKSGDYTCFSKMGNLKKQMCQKYKINPEQFELSMGMSSDFQKAIEEGSTMVRVGRSIFGPRSYPKKEEGIEKKESLLYSEYSEPESPVKIAKK